MQLLGLDVGTTTICAVVVDTTLRKVLRSQTLPNRSQVEFHDDFTRAQDPIQIWETASRLVTDMLHLYPHVKGIGVSGQMHGILYVDNDGNPVSPLYTWQDGRGNLLHSDGLTYASALQSITGYTVASGYGMVTHFYHVCTHTVPKSAVCLCTIGDFVAMKLSNQPSPVIDFTNAASLGVFAREAFDSEALRKAGLLSDFLPEVVPSGTRVGETSTGIRVYAAMGDNQSSFLGAVPSPRGTLLINVGTGAQLSVWSEIPYASQGWEARPFPGEGWLSVAATLGGGKSFALLERFFREVSRIFTGVDVGSLYGKMDEWLPNGTEPMMDEGLQVQAQFFGSRTDPAERGAILNISEENFTPQALTLAWVAGMADEFRALFEHLPSDIRGNIAHLVGSGNGLRKNAALRRAVERALALPMQLSPCNEEAALGAALCAGVGEGELTDFLEVGGGWEGGASISGSAGSNSGK